MSNRVTIKSIAHDLGISHMTVSRALANSPNVRQETREAVVKRARELGYVRSAAAAAMRGDRTAIIGLLLPNLVNEFYARFADKLANCLEADGLQLLIYLTQDARCKERLALIKLHELQAKAVVMVPTPADGAGEETHLHDLKVVQLIRTRPGLGKSASAMLINDSDAIIEAVAHLAGLGRRRLAYIGGDPSLSSGASRLAAFRAGLEAAGLEAGSADIITAMPSFEMGFEAFGEVLDRGRAAAVVCGGFEVSNGALNRRLQHRTGTAEDISFVGYGDPSYYRWIGGGISTISLPVSDLAEKTARLVAAADHSKTDQPAGEMLPAELIVRRSTGRPAE